MHQSCLKNHMCVLGWISRSYARDGNEIQTFGCRRSVGKIEKLGFLIPVNPKHAWKSWNLAWCHDMAPTCCGNFSVRFAKAHTLTINKVILEQVLSRYKSETQVLLKPWVFYLQIGIFFGRIGTSFGVSILQTGASLKKAPVSERERMSPPCAKRHT